MENGTKTKWAEVIEKLVREDTKYAEILLEEIEKMQQEAFMEGYQYAITILQETIVKKKER